MAFRYRLNKATGDIEKVDVFKESITTVEFFAPSGGKRLENKDTKAHKWFSDFDVAKNQALKHFNDCYKNAVSLANDYKAIVDKIKAMENA